MEDSSTALTLLHRAFSKATVDSIKQNKTKQKNKQTNKNKTVEYLLLYINSSQCYWSKVLKISKFIECVHFFFNHETYFLSNLTFLLNLRLMDL